MKDVRKALAKQYVTEIRKIVDHMPHYQIWNQWLIPTSSLQFETFNYDYHQIQSFPGIALAQVIRDGYNEFKNRSGVRVITNFMNNSLNTKINGLFEVIEQLHGLVEDRLDLETPTIEVPKDIKPHDLKNIVANCFGSIQIPEGPEYYEQWRDEFSMLTLRQMQNVHYIVNYFVEKSQGQLGKVARRIVEPRAKKALDIHSKLNWDKLPEDIEKFGNVFVEKYIKREDELMKERYKL
ncbi:MAG: hypothetical protein ABIF40_04765 [archaeon]